MNIEVVSTVIWLFREACAAGCHTGASDTAEASESWGACGEKISGVPSSASYLSDGTQGKSCVWDSREHRGNVGEPAPGPGAWQCGVRLGFDASPNCFLLDDILVS